MITTVTTTTVTLAVALGSLGTIFLIGLLITKELTSAVEKSPFKIFEKFLDIGISPLLVVFSVIVITKVLEVLK